jgi:hypothetical protein
MFRSFYNMFQFQIPKFEFIFIVAKHEPSAIAASEVMKV